MPARGHGPRFSGIGIVVVAMLMTSCGPAATEGTQYGEAVVWTSPDGLAWSRLARLPELADAELTGLATDGSRLVAVGDRGAPDTYVSTVWTSPTGWAP